MAHGSVVDWKEMDHVWRHAFSQLKASPKEVNSYMNQFPILVTEAPLSPFPQKVKMAHTFFDNYSVPAFFLAVQGVLSLF
mgnify:CR=1 FL=1